MNDATTIIIEGSAQSTALATIRAALPTVLGADKDDILGKLQRELAGFEGDPSTPKGREEIASKAYKVSRAKKDLERLATTLKADAQQVIKGVNAEVNIITARMDALRDQVRAPLDEYEARIERFEADIRIMEGWADVPPEWTSQQIGARIQELATHEFLSRDWAEFSQRAQRAATLAHNALKGAKAAAEEREALEAEAARVAAEEAERQRQEAIRQQQEREAEIARQAAERAKAEAEEVARVAAQRADYHRRMLQHVVDCGMGTIGGQPQPYGVLLRELEMKIAFDAENFGDLLPEAVAAKQTAMERINAGMKAAEEREAATRREQEARDAAERAEQRRQEAEERARQQAAQAEAARVLRHRETIQSLEMADQFPQARPDAASIQMMIDHLTGWPLPLEEFAAEAEQARDATLTRLRAMLAEAQDREQHQAEALEQERQRQADAAAAARLKAQQDAERAEAAARERNVAHKRQVNRAAAEAIQAVMEEASLGDGAFGPLAQKVVTAIAKGAVPAVAISY